MASGGLQCRFFPEIFGVNAKHPPSASTCENADRATASIFDKSGCCVLPRLRSSRSPRLSTTSSSPFFPVIIFKETIQRPGATVPLPEVDACLNIARHAPRYFCPFLPPSVSNSNYIRRVIRTGLLNKPLDTSSRPQTFPPFYRCYGPSSSRIVPVISTQGVLFSLVKLQEEGAVPPSWSQSYSQRIPISVSVSTEL
jgi:hypothetical protein